MKVFSIGGVWQGVSKATWDLGPDFGVEPTNFDPRFGSQSKIAGGSLKVVTTKLRPGYLRKNGTPIAPTRCNRILRSSHHAKRRCLLDRYDHRRRSDLSETALPDKHQFPQAGRLVRLESSALHGEMMSGARGSRYFRDIGLNRSNGNEKLKRCKDASHDRARRRHGLRSRSGLSMR